MKHLLLFLCCLPLVLRAQTWPVDPLSGKIIYAEEVPVKDAPKTDLYQRARTWWKATQVKAPAWQVADFANGVLIGRTRSQLRVPAGQSTQVWTLWYTLKIEMEDDRYWYSFYDLQLQPPAAGKAARPPQQALEALVLPQATAAKRKTLPAALAQQTQQTLLALVRDLKASML